MNRILTPALCTLAGIAIGGLAVQGLHAQAKPPVYLVTEITVTNPQAYGKDYAPKAQASIKAAGGKIIALGGAGGAGAQLIKGFDGAPPKRAAILVWDSMEKLEAWYNSSDYQALRKIGVKYAKFRSFAVEGRPE